MNLFNHAYLVEVKGTIVLSISFLNFILKIFSWLPQCIIMNFLITDLISFLFSNLSLIIDFNITSVVYFIIF